MIRALVERLPIMITPRWVEVEAQPIAIDDLLAYLVQALDVELPPGGAVVEIGGAERVSYGSLMREYARQRGLRRAMLRVPVLSPRLSSLWLGLVTPIYARVGRELIESIRHASVVRDPSAARLFAVRPRGMRAAIAAALRHEEREIAESRWFDAFSSSGEARGWAGVHFRNGTDRLPWCRAGREPARIRPGDAARHARRARASSRAPQPVAAHEVPSGPAPPKWCSLARAAERGADPPPGRPVGGAPGGA
jgi:hypothetical protein